MNTTKIYIHPEGGYVIDLPASGIQFHLTGSDTVERSFIEASELATFADGFFGGDITSIVQNALFNEKRKATLSELEVLVALVEEKNEDGD